MESNKQMPLVSVGMPVYNGAKTLRRALDSILAQDYTNFELIISDNASTDETPEICREYAARNSRIRYYRAEKNMGSVWNFNRVFELASGKYFMWAAHDDHRLPSFISKCIAQLEANPGAVLCVPYSTGHMEGINCALHLNVLDTIEGLRCVRKRFIEVLKYLPATAIYGVIRRDAIEKTRLYENYNGAEIVFTNELSLYGEFVQVPEVLFHYYGRLHRDGPKEALAKLHPDNKPPRFYFPFIIVYYNNIKAVLRSPLSILNKMDLIIRITLHELKIILVKLIFRVSTSIFGMRRPMYINKIAEDVLYSNPNFNMIPLSETDENYELWKLWLNNVYPPGIQLNKFE